MGKNLSVLDSGNVPNGDAAMTVRSLSKNSLRKKRTKFAAAILFCLALLAGGIGAWLYLRSDTDDYFDAEPDPTAGPLAGEMKFFPDNVTEIAVYQYDIARSCPGYAEIHKLRQFNDARTAFSFEPNFPTELDAVRAVFVSAPISLAVVTLRHSVSAEELFPPQMWDRLVKSSENGRTIYVDGLHGYWLAGRYLVIGEPSLLRQIRKAPNAKSLTGEMLTAIRKADFNQPELHLALFDQLGGDFGYAEGPGTKSEFTSKFHHALIHADRAVVILTELDYQSPLCARIRLFCTTSGDNQRLAQALRDPETNQKLGPLRDSTITIDAREVTLQATMPPSDIYNLPESLFHP